MYQVKQLRATISVTDFLKEYVDIDQFLACCQACPNYGQKWSCPPYDFDVESYWKGFQTLEIFCHQLVFDKEAKEKSYSNQEIMDITNAVHIKEKNSMEDDLRSCETPEIAALSAGSCHLCESCTRKEQPGGTAEGCCAQFEKMRHSMEALGGNVSKVCEDLLHTPIQWISGDKLPDYLMLVGGLLKK